MPREMLFNRPFWPPNREQAVDSMGKLDTKTRNQASRYVSRLQRRIWRCQLYMFGLPFIFMPLFAFWHELNPFVRGTLFSLFFLVAGAVLLVGNATWLELICFHCPRCGDNFIAPFGFGYQKKVCKHCGLDLRLAVIDKLEDEDLFE
jgi:hypothetical protein